MESNPARDIQAPLPQRVLAGTESAAGELNRLFRQRLCALVRQELNARYRSREDPEDLIQSVFRTFFRRASLGEFHFEHDGALWSVLQRITRRKILKRAEYHGAQARDVSKEERFAEFVADKEPAAAQARMLGDALECALKGLEPLEPEIFRLQLHGYTIAEIIDAILAGLESPYPEILQLRLQGHTESQIAASLGCGRAAVRYRLKRICERLQFMLVGNSE